jgi:hypothetical protein
MMPLFLLENLIFMEGFSNLKGRSVSSSQKKEGPVYVVFSQNLPHRVSFPAETKQVSWELYPGKLD